MKKTGSHKHRRIKKNQQPQTSANEENQQPQTSHEATAATSSTHPNKKRRTSDEMPEIISTPVPQVKYLTATYSSNFFKVNILYKLTLCENPGVRVSFQLNCFYIKAHKMFGQKMSKHLVVRFFEPSNGM